MCYSLNNLRWPIFAIDARQAKNWPKLFIFSFNWRVAPGFVQTRQAARCERGKN